jgi:group I intron endonuclease
MAIIYKATCIINNKSYVGQTRQLLSIRKNRHKSDAKFKVYNSRFHDAINKHGWDNFIWSIIEEISTENKTKKEIIDLLNKAEIKHIALYGDYNIADGGVGYSNRVYYSGTESPNFKIIDKQIRQNIVTDYVTNNLNVIQLRDKYRVCVPKIYEILRQHNVIKVPGMQKGIKKIPDKQLQDSIVIDYCNGISLNAVSRKYKKSKITIKLILTNNNIKLRIKNKKCSKIYKIPLCVRQKMSNKAKQRTKGIENNSWRGTWVTPKGNFDLLNEAAAMNNISKPTLSRLCKNSHVILNNHMIKLNPVLQQLGATRSTTPADLGFNFIYKGGRSH